MNFFEFLNPPYQINIYIDIINLFLSTNIENIKIAEKILTEFENKLDNYTILIPILDSFISDKVKFYILRAANKCFKKNWLIIPELERENLKEFLINYFFSFPKLKIELSLINQFIQTFISMILNEWPEKWDNLLISLIHYSFENEDFIIYFFRFLILLLEHITQSELISILSYRATLMSDNIKKYINQIIELIHFTINSNKFLDFIELSLDCFVSLSHFISPSQVIESKILEDYCINHISNPNLSFLFVKILISTLPSTNIDNNQYTIDIFITIVEFIINNYGTDIESLNNIYNPEKHLDLFLTGITSFLTSYSNLINIEKYEKYYYQSLIWILGITINFDLFFLSCLEFWHHLIRKLYIEHKNGVEPLNSYFIELFSYLRRFFITKVPEPYELIKIIDDDNIEKLTLINRSTFGSSFSMIRECLVFLTNFDQNDMINSILLRLDEIKNNNSLLINDILSFIWAISAISNSLNSEYETDFFLTIIPEIFNFISINSQYKIILIQSFCFLSSQLINFFKKQYIIFKAIMMKLIEFIYYDNQELQSFVLDCFKTLSFRCKTSFQQTLTSDDKSIYEEIFNQLPNLFDHLHKDLLPDFYEFLAISLQENKINNIDSISLFEDLMNKIDYIFQQNIICFEDLSIYTKSLSKLPLYIRNLTYPFVKLNLINIFQKYLDLSQIYNQYIDSINLIQSIRNDTILFIDRSILFCFLNELYHEFLEIKFIPLIIEDYFNQNELMKNPQVLSILSNFLWKFTIEIVQFFDIIFEKVLFPTFEIVSIDLNYSSELRIYFSRILLSFCQRPSLLIELNFEYLDFLINSLQNGSLHTSFDINNISINSLTSLIRNSTNSPNQLLFNEKYLLNLFNFIFNIFIDVNYKFTFESQVQLIITLVSNQYIKDNIEIVLSNISNFLPNRPNDEIYYLFSKILNNFNDILFCRILLKDYLINIKSFSTFDPDLNVFEKNSILNDIKNSLSNCKGLQNSSIPQEELQNPITNITENLKNISILK